MRFILVLAVIALASGAALAGAAGLGDGVQTVLTCAHTGNSQLRLVSSPGDCGNDTVVSWNATVGSRLSGQVGDVFTTSNRNAVPLPAAESKQLLQLALPPGSYSISGKVVLESTSPDVTAFGATCALGPPSDTSETALTSRAPEQTLPLQVVAVFAEPTLVSLSCIAAQC